MQASNNSSFELVQRYLRNKHRAEFVAANPGIPEEILVIVYFRRATANRWAYAPASYFDSINVKWIYSAPLDSKWYEIPVCPEKILKIKQETRERYMDLMQDVP
jgi:hypothetical protein